MAIAVIWIVFGFLIYNHKKLGLDPAGSVIFALIATIIATFVE